MIRVNAHRSEGIRTFLLGLLAAGLVASAAIPASAQASGAWTTTGSLNTARSSQTATLLQSGQVLVVGGQNAAGFLTSAELYNSSTGQWTATGSTATARIDHTATLLQNGEVLVAGGYLGLDSQFRPTYTATAELYNPSTGQWSATGSMTVARAFHGATLLSSGKVLVAGGVNSTGSSYVSAELYDPSTGTWTATTSMNNSHAAPLTLLQDGRALMSDNSNSSYATGEIYDPSTALWTVTGKMYYSHTGVSTILLNSGDVLIYGNKFSCYAGEFFTPSSNTWARTINQCGNSISFGPMVLLGTGKVLLGGGGIIYAGKSSPSSNGRLYDPATNTWSTTGSLKQARQNHTLTLLSNGQALAVGGAAKNSDGTTKYLTAAEFYTP